MTAFVDERCASFGVEPTCKVLQVAPSVYWREVRRRSAPAQCPPRRQRDARLMREIDRVWNANKCVYGADKVWMQLNRERIKVARCTVERLMRRLGPHGVVRGRNVRTTIADSKAPCP